MTDTLTPENVKRLCDFFDTDQHEFRKEKGYADKPDRYHVYLTELAITERLDEVDPAWHFEIKGTWRAGDNAVCQVDMIVKGVTRSGIGMAQVLMVKDGSKEANEAEKAAATDALKRAARLFGVGRYLLKMGFNITNHRELGEWLNKNAKSGDLSAANAHPAITQAGNGNGANSGGQRSENGQSSHWSNTEQWHRFTDSCISKYGLNPATDETFWTQFATMQEAGNAIRGKAEAEQWDMIATSAKYTKMANNSGTIDFNTDLPTKMFEGRTQLAKWMNLKENFFKDWQDGETYELPFPVVVSWQREGKIVI